MTRRIYISDLHLEDEDTPVFQRFAECLAAESTWADEIVILGDLVEMWIGDDDDSALAESLRQTLLGAGSNCRVSFLHGNRDFLLGKGFADTCGLQLLPETHITNDQVLLCHGDSLCTDDTEYQTLRETLRSPAWQADILNKSLIERKALANAMRAQSRTSNANKPSNIMDVNAQATIQLVTDTQARVLVHGHTHRPGVHTVTGTACEARIVLGSWEYCGWLCRQDDANMQLEAFSLARRYENGNTHPAH
ncbi:MAG: UDP-2,3-diacylglucosamine diphosphatase [Pseudomonadota bacterium]